MKTEREGGDEDEPFMLKTHRFCVNNAVRADNNSELIWVDILDGREKLLFGL